MAAGGDFEVVNGGVRVSVKGLSRTLRALSAAGADAEDMRDLMHEIGMTVVRSAHPPRRYGTLAGTLRAGKGKTKAVVRAGGARAPYAGVIHYGWPARGITAQPFLINALRAKRGDVLRQLDDGLADILKKNHLK